MLLTTMRRMCSVKSFRYTELSLPYKNVNVLPFSVDARLFPLPISICDKILLSSINWHLPSKLFSTHFSDNLFCLLPWNRAVQYCIRKKAKLPRYRRQGGEQYSSSFLTSVPNGCVWSASRSGCALSPGKGLPVPIVQEDVWATERA